MLWNMNHRDRIADLSAFRFKPRAVLATKYSPRGAEAMPDYFHAAMPAVRSEAVNRTFETIVGMSFAFELNCHAVLVGVAACLAILCSHMRTNTAGSVP
jgi:hypothetical protein